MPFLTNAPLPQCLQHSSATRRLLARDHDRGCMRHLLEVKCLPHQTGKAIQTCQLDCQARSCVSKTARYCWRTEQHSPARRGVQEGSSRNRPWSSTGSPSCSLMYSLIMSSVIVPEVTAK